MVHIMSCINTSENLNVIFFVIVPMISLRYAVSPKESINQILFMKRFTSLYHFKTAGGRGGGVLMISGRNRSAVDTNPKSRIRSSCPDRCSTRPDPCSLYSPQPPSCSPPLLPAARSLCWRCETRDHQSGAWANSAPLYH